MSQQQHSKRILLLSGVDFKEKSIQVIIKTPQAYSAAGWDVHYIVGRDTSRLGDYFYENVIDPPGIHVYRFIIPLSKIHGLFNHVLWKAFWFRVRNLLLVLSLVFWGIRLLKRLDFDVVYGYEIPGVLAGRIIRTLGYGRKCTFVTRFQGVLYVKEWIRTGNRLRMISNFEAILALKTKADLCIMTNDGSQGTDVLNKLRSPVKEIFFAVNGVDNFQYDQQQLSAIKSQFYSRDDIYYFISVSRLDGHKRLDRGIRLVAELVHKAGVKNVLYTIIGAGAELEKLKHLVRATKLDENVRFLGAVNHNMVKYHYFFSHFFISMYTSTNVGNPLLEAIRSQNIVVTLNNGDTGKWISHFTNGLIYPVDDQQDLRDEDYEKIAADIRLVQQDKAVMAQLKEGISAAGREKLWTWEERLNAEIEKVCLLTQKP